MPIHRHIATLRAKPDHIRQRIAFWTALSVTAVIALFWVASLSIRDFTMKPDVSAAVDKAGSPIQTVVSSVGGFFGDIRDLVFGARKATYSSQVEVVPGK